jgi:hypothetical protein
MEPQGPSTYISLIYHHEKFVMRHRQSQNYYQLATNITIQLVFLQKHFKVLKEANYL